VKPGQPAETTPVMPVDETLLDDTHSAHGVASHGGKAEGLQAIVSRDLETKIRNEVIKAKVVLFFDS
jgi:hypothetical protein